MPHIDLDPSQPGILGLLKFRPDTGAALLGLTDLLLHGPGSLPPGDRELIAALVSRRNDCSFCQLSHGASAAARQAGASDLQIHDTVLIAAAFCMFNRYVDGLATESPTDPAVYAGTGAQLAEHGYTL